MGQYLQRILVYGLTVWSRVSELMRDGLKIKVSGETAVCRVIVRGVQSWLQVVGWKWVLWTILR